MAELRDRRRVEPHVHVAVGRALVLDVDVARKRVATIAANTAAEICRRTMRADMGAARAARQRCSTCGPR
jgi:hypothetical protein